MRVQVMFMAADYKDTREWQALNRIWKTVPQARRGEVQEDFRLIAESIKRAGISPGDDAEAKPASAPRENYLAGMSAAAKKLALRLITSQGFDIYAFLENLLRSSGAQSAQELWDAYVSQADVADEDEEALREIVRVCAARALDK